MNLFIFWIACALITLGASAKLCGHVKTANVVSAIVAGPLALIGLAFVCIVSGWDEKIWSEK